MCESRNSQGALGMMCYSSSCCDDISCCDLVKEVDLSGCQSVAVILSAMNEDAPYKQIQLPWSEPYLWAILQDPRMFVSLSSAKRLTLSEAA